MAIATFICKNCNLSKQTMFKPGKMNKPICDKCGKEMQREWKKIDTGSVVKDTVLYATELMQNTGMMTKNKLVY